MALVVTTIEAEGFGSFKDAQVLTLNGQGPVAVTGTNGVGKSTIASKALTWGLYGKCAPEQLGTGTRSLAGKGVVHDDSKVARVTVMLHDSESGEPVEVERKRSRSKADRITVNGTDATQDDVDRIVGADWEVFVRTCVRGQDDPWNFAGATDAKKRQILDVVSGADRLAIPYDKAKEIARTQTVLVESYRQRVADIQRRAQTVNVDQVQRQCATWDADKAARVQAAEQEVAALQAALEQARAADAAMAGATQKRAEIEGRRPSLDMKPYKDAEVAAVSAFAREQARVSGRRSQREKAKELLAAGKCPTCHEPIKPGSELATQAEAEIDTTEFEKAQAALTEARQAHEAAAVWLNQARQAHEAELAACPLPQGTQAPAAQQAVMLAQRRLEDVRAAENPHRGVLEQAKAQAYALGQESALYEELVALGERDLRIAERWVAALSPKGARAHMAEGALAAIEVEANRWLSALSDGRFAVAFPSTKTSGKGGVSESIATIVYDCGKERDFLQLSGGEKRRVNLACDLGVAAAFTRGGALALSLLVLDEAVFSGVDEAGKQAVARAIHTAGVADVVVIDHDARLTGMLPRTVRVERDPEGYSRVVEVG